MSLPAVERLRESRPDAHIAVVTLSKLADLYQRNPAIDEIISFEKSEGVFELAKRIRSAKFDLFLVLPNSFRSAFEAWLARVPTRAGYARNGRGFLLTQAVRRRGDETRMRKRSDSEVRKLANLQPERPRDTFPPSAHHLHQYLHLVHALGARAEPLPPRIVIAEHERAAARTKFAIPDRKRLFGLNPGAEYGPAKRWPIERFIETAKLVAEQVDANWLIFGGAADQPTASAIQTALGVNNCLNLAGQTSLRELCIALSLCEAVLTNDTGPMHLAAAVGTRVIAPFGSTSPELTGPGLPGSHAHDLILGQAPCAPCFRRTCPIDFRCMLSIQPGTVALRFLAQNPEG